MNRVGAQQILNGLILVKHQQVGSLILGFSGTPPVPTLNAKTSLCFPLLFRASDLHTHPRVQGGYRFCKGQQLLLDEWGRGQNQSQKKSNGSLRRKLFLKLGCGSSARELGTPVWQERAPERSWE